MCCIFPGLSNIFGEPDKSVHSYRIFGYALVDLALTILAAFVIAKYVYPVAYGKSPVKSFALAFAVLMVLGLVFHKIFCVKTKLTNQILG